jgi:type IV pilus modification protein PilV
MHDMKTRAFAFRSTGFSLIEVLVAVVVLSFGLLALAALQGSLFKASAEAKAQTVALGLAAEKLEYFRGFGDMAAYQSIDTGSDAATINVGGVAFARAWTVTRCAYPNAGGNFNCTVANTGALSTNAVTGYALNNEFKRVLVNVTWTNAEGASQRVSLEEAVAALDPADSAKLAKLSSGASPRGPEVRIYNPAMQQQGVIPIAVGNGTDTAATNPKPLVNGTRVIETRFDVLTYNGLSGNTAEQKARVETSIVGCSCDYGNRVSGAKRPTYWDGRRYTAPEDSSVIAGSAYGSIAGPNTSASGQSALCTICCRDHHDPSSLPAGAAKFDPRNNNHSAGHYLLDASTGALSAVRTSGTYTEACRVIRVGGLFRVAADTFDDYQNFLDTLNDGSTTAYLPTSGPSPAPNATGSYQNYVKAYLDARIVNQSSQARWNDVLPIAAPGTVSALETTHNIKATQTTPITINASLAANNQTKWSHLRGLYIDYLEDKALQAIQDAKDSCTGTGTGGIVTQADLETCVLKVLPFTSINLTELGVYSPLGGDQIVVANNNFYDTLSSTAPVRGKVVLGSKPTNGLQTNALARMRPSNSGLTTLIGGIDPDDANITGTTPTPLPPTWTATQPYVPANVSNGGAGGQFMVNLIGYPFTANANIPSINDSLGALCNYFGSSNTSPNTNYVCTTPTLNQARTLTYGRYNFPLPSTQTGLTLTCADDAGLNPVSHTFNSAQNINVCRHFTVTSPNLGGVLGAPTPTGGVMAETTPVAYLGTPYIKNNDVITVTLTEQTQTQAYTCSYAAGGSTALDTDFSVSPETCP